MSHNHLDHGLSNELPGESTLDRIGIIPKERTLIFKLTETTVLQCFDKALGN